MTQKDDRPHSWSEQIEVAGNELLGRIQQLIAEGNVRRLRISGHDGSVILEIPLSVGAAVGGVVTLAAPPLAVLDVLAGLVARLKIEILRDGPPSESGPSGEA
jgi:hypothetical protein